MVEVMDFKMKVAAFLAMATLAGFQIYWGGQALMVNDLVSGWLNTMSGIVVFVTAVNLVRIRG